MVGSLFFAVNCDQRHSRSSEDLVPGAIELAVNIPLVLPLERTTGDEMQCLADRGSSVISLLETLSRQGLWRLGVGIGGVEDLAVGSTREARGTAYVAAREAIDAARLSPQGIAVRGGAHSLWTMRAESALWLFTRLVGSMSSAVWDIVDLKEAGFSATEAARELGISVSAASQRFSQQDFLELQRARALAGDLLEVAQHGT